MSLANDNRIAPAVAATMVQPVTAAATTQSPAVTFADIQAAAQRLDGQIITTPYLHSRTLSQIAGCELYLKFENLQFTASFKERGAGNKLAQLSDDERARGVIAVSAGNHAQGVAYHARRLGIRAVIVMPKSTPFVKVENTRRLGAEVVLAGDDFAQSRQTMTELAARDRLVLVHPFDDAAVIAGQGTLGIEMLAQQPLVDTVVVPIGGGGLISGVALALHHSQPSIDIIGVQSEHFPAMKRAFDGVAGSVPGAPTIAEGIAVDAPGTLTLPIIRQHVKRIDSVTEAQLERAIVMLLEVEKSVVEGAGAAGLAAVLAQPEQFAGRNVGLILCGGNIDSLILSDIIQRSLVRAHRLARLSVRARDVPGSLAKIATLVAEQGANIEEVTHQRAFADLPVHYARIELVMSTRGQQHLDAVICALAAAGYPATVQAA